MIVAQVQPAEECFESRGLLIVGAVGMVGNGVDVRVAPAAEHRGLFLRQKRKKLFCKARLLRRADELHRCTVKALARCLAVHAQVGAHEQLIHRVAQVGKADGADGANGVVVYFGLCIIVHKNSC